MLQQTQVKTVIPFYERWMRKLPTIQATASASPAKLHKLWEGLGYYTRVRNLQRAAQVIVAEHGGNFPTDFDNVLALPGIGRYTAGAICSIAFNQPWPILDGNVIRVTTRLFGIVTNPREKQTNARLWHLAHELVLHASRITHHASPCSHLNQSLMELGALICTPRSPQCSGCPVNEFCVARKQNLQQQLPNLGKRITVTPHRFTAYVVERNGKFLVRQRPDAVVNAHLWEFPNVEVPGSSVSARGVSKVTRHIDATARLPVCNFRRLSPKPLCIIKHSITRYRITLEAYRAEFHDAPTGVPGRQPTPPGQWLTLRQLRQLAFTGAHKKILTHLGAPVTTPTRLDE